MRVLVVDDDPSVRGVVAVALDTMQVLAADQGNQALQMLRAASVDVVLLDVGLPGIDGISVLSKIRAEKTCGNPVVLMLTGRVGELDHAVAFRAGADGYLTKPFEPADLEDAVRTTAARSEEERRTARAEELGRAEFLQHLEQGLFG